MGGALPPFPAPRAAGVSQPRVGASPPFPARRAASLQRASEEKSVGKRLVLSGHGQYEPALLKRAGTKRNSPVITHFEVPVGVSITFYAPHGAALDNPVANLIEQGQPPAADELELVNENSKKMSMPAGYPCRCGAGSVVPDYCLQPPGMLKVVEADGVVTVKVKTLLSAKALELLKANGAVDLHWAACGAAHITDVALQEFFPWRGWYVRKK